MKLRAYIYRLLGYKTIEELFEELKAGKRARINKKELDMGRQLSKDLLPSGLFYPIGGEVFEALEDIEVDYLTHWSAPYTGGGKAILLKGEKITAGKPQEKKQLSYNCSPINYQEVEHRIVPLADINEMKYGGYSLSIDTVVLNRNFKKL